MKARKKQIYNKNSPKRPNTKCLLHQRWNVYPERRMSLEGREVTSKAPTLEELARCPCLGGGGCLWVACANKTQSGTHQQSAA